MKATKVGVREFRSGLAEFIASAVPVAVTRHGQTVGYFIPTHGQADTDLAALKKASAVFGRLLAAPSVDIDPAATELKAARKAGKRPVARPRQLPAADHPTRTRKEAQATKDPLVKC